MKVIAVEPLGAIRSQWRLVLSWARREFHATYRQSALRVLWSVAQPLSVFFVYVVIFHWILRVQGDGLPYLSFMIAGVTVWRYFAVGLGAATVLVEQSHVLGRVYFRREIVPLSVCLTGLLDLAIGTTALVVVAWAQGLRPGLTLLALPLVYVPLVLYTAGAAVLLSVVTVFVRDVGHAMPTITQLLFLATPIMYPPSQIPPELGFLTSLNPIAVLVEQTRDVALRGLWPSPSVLVVSTMLAATFFAVVIVYVRSIEHRIVDIA